MTITGSTNSENTTNIHEFVATNNRISIDSCTNNFDTVITLLDSEGNQLYMNDDHIGKCRPRLNGFNYGSHIEAKDLIIGEIYYIEITGYWYYAFGDYSIQFACGISGNNCVNFYPFETIPKLCEAYGSPSPPKT